jgi:hypothetical protein
MKISSRTSRAELAAIVTKALAQGGISCVLVGGAVVSIYTNNKYESRDLDFISDGEHKKIIQIMKSLGFKNVGKDFYHQNTSLSVEFPAGPLGIGDRVPVKAEGKIRVKGITVILLSPTQCVMDRLAWFFHNNDRQCLDQAIEVAKAHPIKIKAVQKFAADEGAKEKFKIFAEALRAVKK